MLLLFVGGGGGGELYLPEWASGDKKNCTATCPSTMLPQGAELALK